MWLITGPFDSTTLGDETFTKTKLLKPATTYDVGRHKENALFINSKKISRQNGEIILGEHTEEDVTNPAAVPTLSFRNTKSAVVKVDRESDAISINPGMIVDLESGDIIHFSGSLAARLEWSPKICFYVEGQRLAPDIAVCASLGIKLVTKHIRDVNYHLATDVTSPLSPPVLLSLLNLAHFVTPNWLTTMADLPLTQTYTPPNTTKFLPIIEPALLQAHSASIWQPSKSRKSLFDGIRFIFAVIGSGIGTETKAISDVVTRGGGDRQLIDVEKEALGKSTWDSILKKRHTILREGMKSGLVLVGDSEAMLARGVPKATRTAWAGMVEKARGVGMRIIPPSFITEAILTASVPILDCTVEEEVAAPPSGAVPSTHPKEPLHLLSSTQRESQPSEEVTRPARRLTRRAASQTPAPAPVPEPAPAPEAEVASIPMEVDARVNLEQEISESQGGPRKKPLKRRAKTGGLINTLLGLDDGDTSVTDSGRAQSEDVREKSVPVPPTPGNRTSRLRRRAGTAGTQLLDGLTQDEGDSFGVQPLKKFKALFEESGQGRMSVMDEEEEEVASFSGVSSRPTAGEKKLPALVEELEGEESQGSEAQTRKRKADAMDVDEAPGQTVVETAKKRRIVEESNEVEHSLEPKTIGGSNKAKGAAPGKPDTDLSFLRAIASLKRGKRTEDTFDREFNRLRIAKPDIRNIDNAQAPSKARYDWEGLDDFEKDVGIRGNFMQIVELEVWKDKHASVDDNHEERFIRRESGVGKRVDWDGREDFKKFKRRGTNRDREIVPLVLHKAEGYEAEFTHVDFNYGQHTRTRKDARSFGDVSEDRDNDDDYPTFTQSRPSRTKSQPKSRAQAKPPSRPKPIPEEIDDREAGEDMGVIDERPAVDDSRQAGAEGKGKGKAPRLARTRTAKTFQPLFDTDSDEEENETVAAPASTPDMIKDVDLTLQTNLPSQVTTRRGTKRKAMAVIQESDSDDDDGMTFGGFSKKPVRKRR